MPLALMACVVETLAGEGLLCSPELTPGSAGHASACAHVRLNQQSATGSRAAPHMH